VLLVVQPDALEVGDVGGSDGGKELANALSAVADLGALAQDALRPGLDDARSQAPGIGEAANVVTVVNDGLAVEHSRGVGGGKADETLPGGARDSHGEWE
jgi:hypothetical protein